MLEGGNVSITRSQLLARKRQIELTKAGYDLLDKKRLALLQEILRLQEEVVARAAELEENAGLARRALAKAEALIGEEGVNSAAMGSKHELTTEMQAGQLMGVRVPRLGAPSARRHFYERDLGLIGTSLVVDEAASAFEHNVDLIVLLADGELQLSRLMREMFTTTRRLKALEHIIIPRLRAELAFISNALDERERASHFSLKLAKKLLQRKHQANHTA
jgi:V/A-type H+-transporting ATPase subunit D